jgi:hypothetical protein
VPSHPVQPPEWIDAAPIVVQKSVEIDAAPSAVWARIADHETWPEWFTALDRVEVIGRGEGVGGGRRVVIGGRLALDEEFTAWDVDRHFAFGVVSSPLPVLGCLAESVRIEPVGTGCRVVYRQGVQGRRGLGWAMKLVWSRAPGQLDDALARLKVLVEA